MSKFYVFATDFAQTRTGTFLEAEVCSVHTSESAAYNKAEQLRRYKAGLGFRKEHLFAVIEHEEALEKGKQYPAILAQWELKERDKACLDLMCQYMRKGAAGGHDEYFATQLERLDISFEFLKEYFQDRAQEVIDREEAQRQELAHRQARAAAIASEIAKERSELVYSFPAARGIQAEREFFVAQIPFSALVKLFVFDEERVPAEMRAQRVLNPKRAQAVCDYIVNNPAEYVLPALTASVSREMSFESFAVPGASNRLGLLHIPVEALMLINDGQHRRRGIELALAEKRELASETIAVQIHYDQGLERSQQMFADINTKQVKPSASINALYDRRNPFNAWVLDTLDCMPQIKTRVDMENSSVGAKSHKLWSLVSFKKFVTLLTGINEKNVLELDEESSVSLRGFVQRFFDECKAHIPNWAPMIGGLIPAETIREEFVIGHSVWLEALAMFASVALTSNAGRDEDGFVKAADIDWSCMEKLTNVDPLKTSYQWKGRCVYLGKMNKTADGIKSTAAQLLTICAAELPPHLRELDIKLTA